MVKRKNPKRFECLKKKAHELSVLCNVDVLFLCKEDGEGDFYSWPENSGTCLAMIDKYKKKGDSVLGKRKVRDETQMAFCGTIQENQDLAKKARKFENPKLGLGNNIVDVVDRLEYQELLQVLSWVEQTTKEVDGRVQLLTNEIGCSENLDYGVEYGRWLEEILEGSQQMSDQNSLEVGECDLGDTDNNVFDVKKLEEWLENDDQESDVNVSSNEFITAFEAEMGQILQASNQDHVLVDNLKEEDHAAFKTEIRQILQASKQDHVLVGNLEEVEHAAFEVEMRQILLASNQDHTLFNDLEEEDHAAFEAEMRQISQASNKDCILVNNLEEADHSAFETEMRQILQASNQDPVLEVNNLEDEDQDYDEEESEDEKLITSLDNYTEIVEISDTADNEVEEEEKVEFIPSCYQWTLLDFFDHLIRST